MLVYFFPNIYFPPGTASAVIETEDGAAQGCSFRERQVWNVGKCYADVKTTYLDSAIKKTQKQSTDHSLLQHSNNLKWY